MFGQYYLREDKNKDDFVAFYVNQGQAFLMLTIFLGEN